MTVTGTVRTMTAMRFVAVLVLAAGCGARFKPAPSDPPPEPHYAPDPDPERAKPIEVSESPQTAVPDPDFPWWCSEASFGLSLCDRVKGQCETMANDLVARGFSFGPCSGAIAAACYSSRNTTSGLIIENCSLQMSHCMADREITLKKHAVDREVLTDCAPRR